MVLLLDAICLTKSGDRIFYDKDLKNKKIYIRTTSLQLASFSLSFTFFSTMVLLKSFTCITACVLLLQSCAVQAAPLDGNRPLVKRGRQLHGKFLHITGN
jgi:hypothetical protein